MNMSASTSTYSARPSHQNNFNFLRLLFASLVLLSHAPEIADGNRSRELLTRFFGSISFGELAVDGFFLLSGYLIVKSWANEPNAITFLQKRIARIYPGFIVASVVGAYVVGPLGSISSEYFAQFKTWAFIKGIIFLQSTITPPVFVGQSTSAVNSSMWTIFFEFLCYLGVMAAGLAGIVNRRGIWLFLAVSIVSIFCLHKFGYIELNGERFIAIARNFLRLASVFFVGGCFYLFRDEIKFVPKIGKLSAAVLFVGLFWVKTAEIFLAVFGGYLLFYLAHAQIPILRKFNDYPDISYGLYLYGWPVQMLLFWYFPAMSPWVVFPLSLVASAALGFISWHVVEKPCLRLKGLRFKGGRLVNSKV
jgi:peptidoglycan/LPS O-acetylase OafA/YrhL